MTTTKTNIHDYIQHNFLCDRLSPTKQQHRLNAVVSIGYDSPPPPPIQNIRLSRNEAALITLECKNVTTDCANSKYIAKKQLAYSFHLIPKVKIQPFHKDLGCSAKYLIFCVTEEFMDWLSGKWVGTQTTEGGKKENKKKISLEIILCVHKHQLLEQAGDGKKQKEKKKQKTNHIPDNCKHPHQYLRHRTWPTKQSAR